MGAVHAAKSKKRLKRSKGNYMNFKQFCEKVYQGVVEFYKDAVNVKLQEVKKNNGVTLTGLLLAEKDNKVAPAVYLDSYFEDYRKGKKIEDIVVEIVQIYERVRKHQQVDVQFFSDYQKAKERICYKLIHYQRNESLLSGVPHIRYLNLAVVFYYAYENPLLGNGTILIQNSHKESWKVTTEELFRQAKENTERLFPADLIKMEEIVEELLGVSLDEEKLWDEKELVPMFVLTNRQRMFGAISIFYPEVLKELAEKVDANLFILPSSVHEVILLPDAGAKAESLQEMVKDVNSTQVAAEEILSDSVYYYDRTLGRIDLLC